MNVLKAQIIVMPLMHSVLIQMVVLHVLVMLAMLEMELLAQVLYVLCPLPNIFASYLRVEEISVVGLKAG